MKLGSVLRAAGVTPDAYREPEITLNPQVIAEQAAKAVANVLGPRAIPNHNFKDEQAAEANGFQPLFVTAEMPVDKQEKPEGHALVNGLVGQLAKLFDTTCYLAFAEPSLLTKRRTEGAIATVGNVTVRCLVWWNPSQTLGISLSTLVLVNGNS